MLSQLDFKLLEDYLHDIFGTKNYKRLSERISRWALTVEPLNPDAYPKGNTKQIFRWDIPHHLYSYLYASQDTCYSALHRLLAQIVFMQGVPDLPTLPQLRAVLLDKFPTFNAGIVCPLTGRAIRFDDVVVAILPSSRIGRSEINIDFIPSQGREILDPDNLSWIYPPYHLYLLRDTFRSCARLLEKTQTKSYLTDRRQTGDYPSNRERRWEINPSSPQFATYTECIRIEVKLLAQILEFSKAPQIQFDQEVATAIQAIIGSELKSGNFRCPISGQFIAYDTFVTKVAEAEHGSSPYHVAHLIPLARTDGRHAATNISWITELGNRVQGEDAFEDIVDEIFMMAQYHKERLGLDWSAVEHRVQQHSQVKQG
jgi:hypothetical protein